MARKPNYSFERMERERLKAIKATQKAEAKAAAKQAERNAADGVDDRAPSGSDDQ